VGTPSTNSTSSPPKSSIFNVQYLDIIKSESPILEAREQTLINGVVVLVFKLVVLSITHKEKFPIKHISTPADPLLLLPFILVL
jgi:hypothetical protein